MTNTSSAYPKTKKVVKRWEVLFCIANSMETKLKRVQERIDKLTASLFGFSISG
jgi:hypothetical protein